MCYLQGVVLGWGGVDGMFGFLAGVVPPAAVAIHWKEMGV